MYRRFQVELLLRFHDRKEVKQSETTCLTVASLTRTWAELLKSPWRAARQRRVKKKRQRRRNVPFFSLRPQQSSLLVRQTEKPAAQLQSWGGGTRPPHVTASWSTWMSAALEPHWPVSADRRASYRLRAWWTNSYCSPVWIIPPLWRQTRRAVS